MVIARLRIPSHIPSRVPVLKVLLSVLLPVLLALFCISCESRDTAGSFKPGAASGAVSTATSDTPAAPAATEIRKEYRSGPVLARLVVDKDSVTIAETVTFTIEVEAEEGVDVKLPEFGDKLGRFGILDYREEPPQLTGEGRIRTGKIYKLEPFLSGDYKIEPMRIFFSDKASAPGDGDGGARGETQEGDSAGRGIETEELTIKVRSLLGEDRSRLTLNPLVGPVDLPRDYTAFMLYAGGCLAALAALAGGVYLWRRRRGKRAREAEPPPPAHEIAFRQIREVLDEGLLDRGEFKLFFSRISDVLRHYIENRFGMRAPRYTTEEFLAAINRDAPFSPERRALLDEFLRCCDLVKFAERPSTREEALQILDACKAFIRGETEETKAGETDGGKTKTAETESPETKTGETESEARRPEAV